MFFAKIAKDRIAVGPRGAGAGEKFGQAWRRSPIVVVCGHFVGLRLRPSPAHIRSSTSRD